MDRSGNISDEISIKRSRETVCNLSPTHLSIDIDDMLQTLKVSMSMIHPGIRMYFYPRIPFC
jgi:hypothetical protein